MLQKKSTPANHGLARTDARRVVADEKYAGHGTLFML